MKYVRHTITKIHAMKWVSNEIYLVISGTLQIVGQEERIICVVVNLVLFYD